MGCRASGARRRASGALSSEGAGAMPGGGVRAGRRGAPGSGAGGIPEMSTGVRARVCRTSKARCRLSIGLGLGVVGVVRSFSCGGSTADEWDRGRFADDARESWDSGGVGTSVGAARCRGLGVFRGGAEDGERESLRGRRGRAIGASQSSALDTESFSESSSMRGIRSRQRRTWA